MKHISKGRIPAVIMTLVALFACCRALAATEITFSISGMDPVNVMRFHDEETNATRIGYIQSTDFSHTINEGPKVIDKVEDGIIYYSVILTKQNDENYQMDISYDFASRDGKSEGIRNRSTVNIDMLKAITSEQIKQKAKEHAEAFTPVVFDYFLKNKLSEEVKASLMVFLTELNEDLLKSLSRDGIMIIRRWDDLTGSKGV